jgi:hypothetical protein
MRCNDALGLLGFVELLEDWGLRAELNRTGDGEKRKCL